MNITFKKAAFENYETVLKWLAEPHIIEFWDNSQEHKDDILIFMKGRIEPSPYFEGIFDYWLGFIDNEPFCLLMTSDVLPYQDLPENWIAHLSKAGKTYTIDFMIGNKKYLGKGLGGETLDQFTRHIHSNDPKVDTFIIDPAFANPRAKKVYEKGGFNVVDSFYRKFNDVNLQHYLMVKRI